MVFGRWIVSCGVFWSGVLGPNGADGAREEHRAVVPARHFQRVGIAAEIERPGLLRLLLSEHREERRHVVDGADLVLLDRRGDIARLGAVDDLERPAVDDRCHVPPPPAGGDDVVRPVALTKLRHQLDADLPERAGNENLAHGLRLRGRVQPVQPRSEPLRRSFFALPLFARTVRSVFSHPERLAKHGEHTPEEPPAPVPLLETCILESGDEPRIAVLVGEG